MAQFLLAAGTDVTARDRWGYTAYDDAIRAGQTKLADMLLQYYREKHGKQAFIPPPPPQIQPSKLMPSPFASVEMVGAGQEQSP